MAPSSTSPNPQNGVNAAEAGTTLWKIESISGKGKGLLATQTIMPGTQILSEPPLLTTDVITSIETTEKDLARALRALPKDSQRAFLSLHNNYPGKNPLSNIIRSNGYPLGPSSDVGGVFATISRINHSCLPNAVQAWNPLRKEETVYAVREIGDGEEITLSYHAGGPSKQRQEILLEGFGFECRCELCSLPASQLASSDNRLIRAQNLDSTIGDSQSVRFSPGRVLKNCKTLYGIFQEERIKDDRLSRLWYDAFQVCGMHGDCARASAFAQRYCEAKKMAAGPDSVDVLEMGTFVKRPESHDCFGATRQWKSEISDIPKGLEEAEVEKWLWREDV